MGAIALVFCFSSTMRDGEGNVPDTEKATPRRLRATP